MAPRPGARVSAVAKAVAETKEKAITDVDVDNGGQLAGDVGDAEDEENGIDEEE
jgi:hypothetical protein